MSEPGTVEVVVPLPVPGRYHYAVPAPWADRARVGARVLVRFGPRKVTGVIVRTGTPPPEGVAPVALSEILDAGVPALPAELVELCLWIADYYEAPPGEVMRAALPAGSGVAARAAVTLTPEGRAILDGEGGAIAAPDRAVLAKLAAGPRRAASFSAAEKKRVAALAARGFVVEGEQRDKARARLPREKIASLAVPADDARKAVASSRSAAQRGVVDELVGGLATVAAPGLPVAAPGLPVAAPGLPVAAIEARVAGAKAALRALAKAGLVTLGEREIAADAIAIGDSMPVSAPPVLTAEQQVAVDAITAGEQRVFLLHGVTGSGKTEVYLRVIATVLDAGKTALVLVPEISLTPQLAARFRARFGDQVAILHSGLSESARLGEWSRLRSGEARIAVGARSAVFAPLSDLGAIVIDEEHDGSFKQDEGVRYHARDVALVRAQRTGAICVLGSATPSLESMAHAERGAYRLLRLTERPTARPMPEVTVVDLRTHMADGEAMLSAPLRAAIGETLANGDQTILFLNRRGFATFVLCKACGHAFRCPHCSVSLTYHKHSDRLSCHYCNFQQRVPEVCPECKSPAIERKGLGTERIAAAVADEFPTARVARLDRDVASGAKIEAVLARVARREVDILVGTQMVTKGHDFPGVTLVGVLCADTGLTLPDFRASERTFQLLAQVAGRAGRGERAGRVLVQTYRTSAPAVTAAAAHDYGTFFTAELDERRGLGAIGFPPHSKLILVRVDGADPHEVAGTAAAIATAGRALVEKHQLGDRVEVMEAHPALVEKVRGRTRWQVMLRGTDRPALRRAARGAIAIEVPASVRVALDVDPVSSF
jgi:primosomal protein N' (replication factor Y)